MSSQPNSGIQTVTGAQIPLDAAYIANLAAQNALTARGQDINASIQQAQMATQAAIANGNNATQLAAAQLSAMTAAEQIKAQLFIDTQRLGLDRAKLLYEQRLGQVQGLLDYNGQMLQAQGLRVDSKFRALELLASRSGPQDFVAYNNLLNQMGTPTGQMVDPTQFANDITNPERPDFSRLDLPVPEPQQYTSTFNPQEAVQAAAANIPQTQVPTVNIPAYPSGPASSAPAQSTQAAANGYKGVPLADVKSGWNLLTTGSGGDFTAADLDPSVKAYDQNKNPVTGTISANTPYWFYRAANGMPFMREAMAMVGDARHANPAKGGAKPELVLNPTQAPIAVIPHEQTRAIMQRAGWGGKRYADGTFWDSPGGQTIMQSATDAPVGVNLDESQYGMFQPAWQPDERKAWGEGGGYQSPRGGGRGPRTDGAGASPWASWFQRLGIDPQTGQPMVPQVSTPLPGGGVAAPGMQVNQQAQAQSQALQDGSTAPVFEADMAGSGNTTPPPSTAPQAGQSYGMPGGLQYTVYSPEVLANMPYLQKLFGGGAVPEFQGFGANLSVPSMGIASLPDQFSLQRYSAMMPTEQDMVRSLYTQGAAMDWNDLMGRIRRATPLATQFSGGPVGYGG